MQIWLHEYIVLNRNYGVDAGLDISYILDLGSDSEWYTNTGFLNRDPRPPWEPRNGSPGDTSRGFY